MELLYSWTTLTLDENTQLKHWIMILLKEQKKKLFILINVFLWSSFWKAKEFLVQILLLPLTTVLL